MPRAAAVNGDWLISSRAKFKALKGAAAAAEFIVIHRRTRIGRCAVVLVACVRGKEDVKKRRSVRLLQRNRKCREP